MVCYEEGSAQCVVHNTMPGATTKRITLMVRPSYKVSQLFDDIRNQMQVENFDVSLQTHKEEEETLISEHEDKTLSEIGIDFSSSKKRTTIKLVPISTNIHRRSAIVSNADSTLPNPMDDDDLVLGASASPVEPLTASIIPLEEISTSNYNDATASLYPSTSLRSSVGYVGLVNQAMTCYLNSLLQALFMTPEFRNALYNWEWDGNDASKNIPYQLQRLFVNLQTSMKMSVETTDLTRSFGWDSTEAWQQHDIQELCRVMFDTLEQKFKDTAQADFINRLYEGKMVDYVKCLECGTEKQREDKFLDIPLPVRPFGSQIAYGSVEEALRAFVEPEILEGNNQYHCEKCNKKCNAHKGLKFSKFPYILTLHLKRFDFDYQTFLRIKLNDKVTFPQTLNLNSFIRETDTAATSTFARTNSSPNNCDTASSEHGSVESAIKCDDCSTTDSGSVLEEEVGAASLSSMNHKSEMDGQEDDEGIDMSSNTLTTEPGPYSYELFSIMIHSGSASGGHYYAYIKDFETGQWHCFNDQSVSTINNDDIEKSFGGALGARAFYTSVYSSSTNAYMLMYRQIDPRRNVSAIKCEEFPEHIRSLQLTLKEECERKLRSQDYNTLKYKVFYFDARTKQMTNVRIFLGPDATLDEALENVHKRLKLHNVAPMSRCRLVAYDSCDENIQCSFDGKDQQQIRDLMNEISSTEMLLEIRDEDTPFEICVPGDIDTKVYTVDMATSDIDGPINARIHKYATVEEYKRVLSRKLQMPVQEMEVATLKYLSNASLLKNDDLKVSNENIIHKSKVFVTSTSQPFPVDKYLSIVERSHHIISLHFTLPKTDKETLEKLSIPSYEPNAVKSTTSQVSFNTGEDNEARPSVGCDVVDAIMNSPPILPLNQDYENETMRSIGVPLYTETLPYRTIEQPTSTILGPESNSEDSSLSDGDRTLVGDASPILSTANSPACSDQHLSSPEDHTKINGDIFGRVAINFDDLGVDTQDNDSNNYYFKATYYEDPVNNMNTEEPVRMLKVLAHRYMKIMNLKCKLEPYIEVPMEYFKIFRHSSALNEFECSRLNEDLQSFSDGERLTIELGRALREGEYKCKVYYMKLTDTIESNEATTFLCDWILCAGATVEKTKRELLAQIATIEQPFEIPFKRCRIRRKCGNAPGKIFLDNQVFGDDIVLLSTNYEIFVQELDDESQNVDDPDSLTVFTRRWYPSQMTLGPFKEVTICKNDTMRSSLLKLTDIPEENIEFAKVMGTFPHHNMSVLEINTLLNWNSNPTSLTEFPLSNVSDGTMIFYRDKTEELKQLTPTERQEIKNQDNNSYSSPSLYSMNSRNRRRERALKIYVDTSPKKQDD